MGWRATHGSVGMNREDVLNRYVWTEGDCFRCARPHVPVTLLGHIDTPIGVAYDISACQECVLVLEGERERLALRVGRPFKPGRLGRLN